MPDIQELANEGLETAAKYLSCLNEMIDGDKLIEKEKVVAIRVGSELLKTIFDRTFPKLLASRNINVDVDMSKVLSQLPTPLLVEVQRHLALQEVKYVKSESRPCAE